jgi:hypothetical protein
MRSNTRAVAFAAAALSLVLAGPAAADSIVYEKDANIWIANPDGGGQYQVTTDGTGARPYGWPSQADDGTIVAAQGTDIVRLGQNGQVLSRFDPPATTDSAGQPIDGVPQDVAVSPDGSNVAFSYYQYGCPPGVACGARTVMLYSSSSAATPVSVYGKQYRRNPSWLSDGRILAFGGYLSQVNLDSPGGGDDDDQHWFDDQDINSPSTDLGDGELSRQGDRLVTLRNYGQDLHLQIYAVSGNLQSGPPPGPPAQACYSGADSSLDNPTWSPDGRSLAYAVAAGIEVIPLPNVAPGDCSGAGSSTLVIPGGSSPDWGPAAINPGPRGDTGAGPVVSPPPRGDTGAGPVVSPPPRGQPVSPRAKCAAKPAGKARARCVKAAKRAKALRKCKRIKAKSARARCIRKVNRRFAR